jgi:hypothetical protein
VRDKNGLYEYGILITFAWQGLLWRRTISTDTYSTFDLGTIVGNPLNMPVVSTDAHWTLGIGLSYPSAGQTVVHIMGNSHADHWWYTTKNVTSWPPSTTWTTPSFASLPWSATGLELHTYAYFANMSDGTLIGFFDQEDSAVPTTAGRDVTAWYMPVNTSTWLPLLGSTGYPAGVSPGEWAITAGSAPTTDPDRVYISGCQVERRPNGVERLHVSGVWARRDPADPFLKRAPYYCYTDTLGDINAWRGVDGTQQSMPLTWANRAVATIGPVPWTPASPAPEWSETGGAGLAVDINGYPHIIVRNADIATPKYVELYWDGGSWLSRAVSAYAAGSSGGPGIFSLRGEVFTIGAPPLDGGRLRCQSVTTGQLVDMAGVVPNGVRPVPEPNGIRDQERMAFLIPDGDTPRVYSFGDHHRCVAS